MTQNPPCNTLATVQTSHIERPDSRVRRNSNHDRATVRRTPFPLEQLSTIFSSNTFTIGNLISFICALVSHFSWSAVKYTLKTQKSQRFLLYKMTPFSEPLSPNPALLGRNLNTSQTKEQKRRFDWCEINTVTRRSDWCEIHTLIDLIGASNIPLSIR